MAKLNQTKRATKLSKQKKSLLEQARKVSIGWLPQMFFTPLFSEECPHHSSED